MKKFNILKDESCGENSTANCVSFKPEYRGHYVVQTLEQRNQIPCELRMQGLLVTIVKDAYSIWQIQTFDEFSVCDNDNVWVKIDRGEVSDISGNLLLIYSKREYDKLIRENAYIPGQMVMYLPDNKYYKLDTAGLLVDPFPNKLENPIEYTTEDDPLLVGKLLIYKDGKAYLISRETFESNSFPYESVDKTLNFNGHDVSINVSEYREDKENITNFELPFIIDTDIDYDAINFVFVEGLFLTRNMFKVISPRRIEIINLPSSLKVTQLENVNVSIVGSYIVIK